MTTRGGVYSPGSGLRVCSCSLWHQREGLHTHGWTRNQADGDAAQCSGVMNPHHSIKRTADGVDIPLLAVLVSAARIQDVSAVQDQDEDVDLGRL